MKDVVFDACERALNSMTELDCDDAGVNQVAFVGWFWGKWWFVTRCVSYDEDPTLTGHFSVLICGETMQSPMDERWMASVFGHCTHGQIFLGEELSAEDLAYQIREWPNLDEIRNVAQA